MRSVLKLLAGVTFVAFTAASCSGDSGGGYGSNPTPPPPPKDCTAQWAAAKVVLTNDCVGCHDGKSHPAVLPQAAFDASPMRAQVDGGKMPPPPATLAAADKATLDAYLDCSGK